MGTLGFKAKKISQPIKKEIVKAEVEPQAVADTTPEVSAYPQPQVPSLLHVSQAVSNMNVHPRTSSEAAAAPLGGRPATSARRRTLPCFIATNSTPRSTYPSTM